MHLVSLRILFLLALYGLREIYFWYIITSVLFLNFLLIVFFFSLYWLLTSDSSLNLCLVLFLFLLFEFLFIYLMLNFWWNKSQFFQSCFIMEMKIVVSQGKLWVKGDCFFVSFKASWFLLDLSRIRSNFEIAFEKDYSQFL